MRPVSAPVLCAAITGLLLVAPPAAVGQAVNLNDDNTLCLELRSAGAAGAQGSCNSNDSECPPGLQCTDTDGDPLNGAVCMDHACAAIGEQVVVDVELGPTQQIACGAQVFLEWDTAALSLEEMVRDPDGELGWNFVLLDVVNEQAGTLDVALSLEIGTPCDATTGTMEGGTIARLTFSVIAQCESFGVRFRDHNPVTKVSGPLGTIPMAGCNGEPLPSATDPLATAGPTPWECPQLSTVCSSEHTYGPIRLLDDCDSGAVPAAASLCTVEHFALCSADPDCTAGGACVDGLCSIPAVLEPAAWLDCSDGCNFPAGLTTIACAYTNACGVISECRVEVPVGHGLSHDACNDGYACTHDVCTGAGACSSMPSIHGDVNGDQQVDLADLLCTIDGYRGEFSQTCTRGNCDVGPCGGDDLVDLQDVVAVIDAFQGSAACCADPVAACCTDSGCMHRSQADCTAANGQYQGDGTLCGATTCP